MKGVSSLVTWLSNSLNLQLKLVPNMPSQQEFIDSFRVLNGAIQEC